MTGTTKDIGVVAGGFADAAAQDAFCATRRCSISIIYDQSGRGNDLTSAPGGMSKYTADNETNAKLAPITISGHNLYGEYNPIGVGYRKSEGNGTATGDNPETIYMVADGRYTNDGCCFEYGNVEKYGNSYGAGEQEAVYFGKCQIWNKGANSGPWVMADLGYQSDAAMFAGSGDGPFNNDPSVTYKFVTGMVKSGKAGFNRLVVKVGNAQSGGLTTVYDGGRLEPWNPMRKEGGITLGPNGVNNDAGQGKFYEGVMTAHCSSDSADDDVQANIVSVYGH